MNDSYYFLLLKHNVVKRQLTRNFDVGWFCCQNCLLNIMWAGGVYFLANCALNNRKSFLLEGKGYWLSVTFYWSGKSYLRHMSTRGLGGLGLKFEDFRWDVIYGWPLIIFDTWSTSKFSQQKLNLLVIYCFFFVSRVTMTDWFLVKRCYCMSNLNNLLGIIIEMTS